MGFLCDGYLRQSASSAGNMSDQAERSKRGGRLSIVRSLIDPLRCAMAIRVYLCDLWAEMRCCGVICAICVSSAWNRSNQLVDKLVDGLAGRLGPASTTSW